MNLFCFFPPFTFWEGYLAGTFTGISTAISDLCYGLAFLSEAFYFNDSSWLSSSWLPFARLYQGHSLVAIALSLYSSLLLPLGFGDHPSICGFRFHHFSFALHFQLPLLSRPTATTSFDPLFPFSCTPRLFRSPILSLPRLQLFFFIVYRRWMSGRRVFWLVDEFSSLLPLFNSVLDLALRKYEFELAALFSLQIRIACVSFFSVFPHSTVPIFSDTSISLLSSAWSYASRP